MTISTNYVIIMENIRREWYLSMENKQSNSIIPRPQWTVPLYSKKQIDKAGKIISDSNSTDEEKKQALEIINNWRSSHAYPLQIIAKNLRDNNKQALVVQRLKRLDSIVGKLKRNNNQERMSLYKMQDIGGCRVIVDTIDDVYKAEEQFAKSRIRHEKKHFKDYIKEPKKSGYRSYHVVYKYHSDKNDTYNKNMLIEIQFRTKLQHLWATALETMGIYTKQNLKASEGEEGILRFFTVISSYLALLEGTPVCPNTSDNLDELVEEIKYLNKKYKIQKKLLSIRATINYIKNEGSNGGTKYAYYILLLDTKEENRLQVFPYTKSHFDLATKSYDAIESRHDPDIDVVLVSAESLEALRQAYPNYFADIEEFVKIIIKICK